MEEKYKRYKQIVDTIDRLYPRYSTDTHNWDYIKELAKERDKLINEIDFKEYAQWALKRSNES